MDSPTDTTFTYEIVDSPGQQTAKQAILWNEANLDELLADYNAHTHANIDTDDLAAAAKTGSDTKVVTGTAGTSGDVAVWNADGDLVDGPTPPTGTLVGTTDTQTLTNKTIDGDDNTLQDIPYSAIKSTSRSGDDATLVTGTAGTDGNTAIWNADGDIVDGPTPPSGDIVGTTDTQTLTNKTLLHANNTGAGLVPAGAIMAFAMETAPTGWLECNGAAVSRATYSVLFSAIGDTHGVGDGSTTFNLPDYRGQFLRGWDHGEGTDPNAATRTDAGDGSTTGDHVGTKQADGIKAHTHGGLDTTGGFLFANSVGGDIDKSGATGSTGGDETRPTNINVMYCIKF